MDVSAASVCLSVCLSTRYRTIKRRMMKLGGYVQGTKISPEFACEGQGSKVKASRDKKRKSATFLFGSRLLGRSPCVAFFSGAVLGGASTPVGKSAHAVYCCLNVSPIADRHSE